MLQQTKRSGGTQQRTRCQSKRIRVDETIGKAIVHPPCNPSRVSERIKRGGGATGTAPKGQRQWWKGRGCTTCEQASAGDRAADEKVRLARNSSLSKRRGGQPLFPGDSGSIKAALQRRAFKEDKWRTCSRLPSGKTMRLIWSGGSWYLRVRAREGMEGGWDARGSQQSARAQGPGTNTKRKKRSSRLDGETRAAYFLRLSSIFFSLSSFVG